MKAKIEMDKYNICLFFKYAGIEINKAVKARSELPISKIKGHVLPLLNEKAKVNQGIIKDKIARERLIIFFNIFIYNLTVIIIESIIQSLYLIS